MHLLAPTAPAWVRLALERFDEVLVLQGTPLLGIVLNGVDPSRVPPPMPYVKGSLTGGERKFLSSGPTE